MNYKVKIITGFRKDQEYSIDADEAHKAYYLFFNPEHRAVFKSGLAIKGEEIKKIEPDYNGTMGWSPTYLLGDYDWAEIKQKGLDRKLMNILSYAKEVAQNEPHNISKPLSLVATDIPRVSEQIQTKQLADKFNVNGGI